MEGTIALGAMKIPVDAVLWAIVIGLLATIVSLLGYIIYWISG